MNDKIISALDKYSQTFDAEELYQIISELRVNKEYLSARALCAIITETLSLSKVPYNFLDDFSIIAYNLKEYGKSFDIINTLLSRPNLKDDHRIRIHKNRHALIDHIKNKYIEYPEQIIQKICSELKMNTAKEVTFTMTSCRRFDLFATTVNSFLNCCLDLHLICKWVCIDDNSNEEDRKKMKERYPFFTFYWKKSEEKGHPKSMNILWEMIETPFIFHSEDDFKYFERKEYITPALKILKERKDIGQVLLNKNYAEESIDLINIVGGIPNQLNDGERFIVHEHYRDKSPEMQTHFSKLKPGQASCGNIAGYRRKIFEHRTVSGIINNF